MMPPPEPFSLPVVRCPACQHGIDPHGLEPGDYCGVGTLTEDDSGEGRLINVACECLWSPNDIAAHLIADEQARHPTIPALTRATMDVALPMIYDTLRAKVQALASPDPEYNNAIRDVLALFDGSSDD